jgi:ATP-dependent DNA helicase Q1
MYTTNVYLILGPKAPRFVYLSKEEVLETPPGMLELLFIKPIPKSRGGKKKKDDDDDDEDEDEEFPRAAKRQKVAKKPANVDGDDEEEHPRATKRQKITKKTATNRGKKRIEYEEIITSDENSSIEEVGWMRTYRDLPAPIVGQALDDILELSSD